MRRWVFDEETFYLNEESVNGFMFDLIEPAFLEQFDKVFGFSLVTGN